MLKCILIYLWLYCGLFYMIEAGEDDEHVHIKLHVPGGGQRKRAQQLHLHQQQHHKKRHALPPTHHHHKHYHHNPKSQSLVGPPPSPPSPALTTSNYLAGITPTSASSSSSKNLPQHYHESDGSDALTLEEEIYGHGGDSGLETNSEEPMMIPSYMATNFALFPQPTATYETEIIPPHNNEGFNVVDQQQHNHHHPHHNENGLALDNEITAPAAIAALKGSSLETQFMLSEQQQQQQLDKPIQNEQLLQQLLQQHQAQNNDEPATKLHNQKYRDVKDDYRNEEDMKEALVMYSSSPRHQPTTGSTTQHSSTLKALSVDDIWSQLQRQYLKKYAPQAQPFDSAEEQRPASTVPTKTQRKRKRNTKRYKQAKPNRASAGESYSSSSSSSSFTWPTNILNLGSNQFKQHKRQPQPQHQTHSHFGDIHSTLRETDVFAKRPSYSIRHNHDTEGDFSSEDDRGGGAESDESLAADNSAAEDDITIDEEVYGDGYGNANANANGGVNHHHPDDSYEEAVYQRGKKFAGYTAYGQHNPFNYHDLYGAYSTAITATVPTKLQPSTYHPNAVASTQTTATNSVFLPTLQQPSTSYQWRTQQTYPTSYQSYHLQHQWPAVGGVGEGRHHPLQASALRPTKSTITQTPHTILAQHSNDFTSPSSSASFASSAFPLSTSVRSTIQTPALAGTSPSSSSSSSSSSRYKKRKNRTKAKRNRIVVI